MYFFAISTVSLGLAFLPMRISLLGRILAMLTAASAWLYASALSAGQPPPGIGALGRFVSLSDAPLGIEGVTAGMSLALAILAAFSSRALVRKHRFEGFAVRLPRWFSYTALALALFSSLYLALALGVENVLAYSGYGSIKAWREIFAEDAFGRLVATGFRPLMILVIVLAIANHRSDRWYLCLAMPAVALALALGLSEASRIVAVYCAAAAISLLLVGRRMLALVALFAVFLSVAYALEARSQRELGLTYVPEYLANAFANEELVADVLTNVSSGLFVTSASAKVTVPESYGEAYKVLSFLPTIDLVDGFQAAKAQFEQRVLSYIPFNAFAEAALFGPLYWALFWLILAGAALSVNSSIRYGTLPFLALLCLFCLGWIFASQYPVRNCLRYFYALFLLRAALPYLDRWWRRRAVRAAARAKSLPPSVLDRGSLATR